MTTNNREEVTQEQLDQLVEDASYLQDEAEALKYVIDEVPYTEAPPEGRSIAELLLLIDHAQLSYYRPVMEEALNNPRPTHLKDFEHFSDTFELDEEKAENIQKVLNKIVKHRAGLVNLINRTPLIDWETQVHDRDREYSLFEFASQMIRFERNRLKDIADLVMVFNQEKQTRREIKKRTGNPEQATDN
ncbi:MAG: hypothetical protein R3224_10025 [Balneolaceae bacterium]|nr:hypothetical protein [Balneolaceae bacterium]